MTRSCWRRSSERPAGTVSKTGTLSSNLAAALVGRDAGHELRAVCQHLRCVEGAGGACDALAKDSGLFVDENAHGVFL